MDFENIEKRKIKSVERETTAKIERWGAEGVSIAYDTDNKVILVRYAIPGETCKINIYKESKDYCLGEPSEFIERSKKRIEPSCRYFAVCGGCDFQMLTYEDQIDIKKSILKETFSRIAGINCEFTDTIRSPMKFNYRNTVTFKANPKRQTAGFFRKDTKSIVDIDECKIASAEINSAYKKIRNSDNFPPHNFKLRSTADGDIVVNMIKTDDFEDREVYETIKACGKEIKFKISKDSFFQINNSVIPLWLEKIVSFLDQEKSERIFDLYCGIGLITLFVSFFAKETIGVEIAKSSVDDGNHNIKINKIDSNVSIIQSAVEDKLSELGYADVMIVDPPRKGLDENTRAVLMKMKPKKIIYSSCKASTMARDIKELSSLYDIKELIPVDMFPQTHHIEMLALLTLK